MTTGSDTQQGQSHDRDHHDDGHGHGHGHGHGSDHQHDDQAPASAENPFAGQGSVVLDIGDDVGAIVVTMPADLLGEEIEIRPAGQADGSHLPHVAVVNRPVNETLVPSLVFGEVVEGRYELCPKGTHDIVLTVDVVGGEVTTAAWPNA